MAEENVQYIRGFPMPKAPWFQKKNIEDAMDYLPRDGDIIIASYPKTGTTWLQYIALQILSHGEYFPEFEEVSNKAAPFMETTGVQAVEALTPPRVYKHHLPHNMVKINKNSKIIYTYRNPEDTFVSLYHFLSEMDPSGKTDVDEFLLNFIDGKIGYGNYFHHLMSFYPHRNEPYLLMVSYEKLHRNRAQEILRIAKFIGEDYFKYLSEKDHILNKVMEHTSFDYMKKNLKMSVPVQGRKHINFFRKGTVGDSKIFLSQEQRKLIWDSMREVMKGTEIEKEWKDG